MTDLEKKVSHVSHFRKFYDNPPPLPSFPDIRYVLLSTMGKTDLIGSKLS